MKPRVLVLIVILLSLCWIGLSSLGLSGGPAFAGRLNLKAPSLGRLRSRLTARLPVSQMILTIGDPAACELKPDRLTVPGAGSCTYAIQPDARKTRRLSLGLGSSSPPVNLVLVQPGYLDQPLEAGATTIDLDIFQNDQNQNAELTVSCIFSGLVGMKVDPGLLPPCILEIN